jgi:hypothetical protein
MDVEHQYREAVFQEEGFLAWVRLEDERQRGNCANQKGEETTLVKG